MKEAWYSNSRSHFRGGTSSFRSWNLWKRGNLRIFFHIPSSQEDRSMSWLRDQ